MRVTPDVRVATVGDAAAIAAIGSVAFPAVHADIAGPEFVAAVVAQTYSLEALTACITMCADAEDAIFLVAELDGSVVGYLHFDSEGPESELHRIYVDPASKRGGIGSALVGALHSWLQPGTSYVLMVAEANVDARAFYERHGLTVERRVDGNVHYMETMGVEAESAPAAAALLMRYTAPA